MKYSHLFYKQLLRNKMTLVLFGFSILLLITNKTYSQSVADSSSKMSVKIKLNYKKSNDARSLKVSVSRKENKKNIPVNEVIVNFYMNEVKKYNPTNGTGWIGNVVTDEEGEGIVEIYNTFNKITAGMHEYTFIARVFNDPRYEDTQEEITIKDAKIILTFTNDDSVTKATAKLIEIKDSAEVLVPETELKLCIKRTFSLLPIGDEVKSTDDKGEVSSELPFDIPADPHGNLTVVARVEDNENYGTVETFQDISWNVLPNIEVNDKRSLWSSGRNAPLSLVFTSVSIIMVVWGVIIYLVFQLFKIPKLGKIKTINKENVIR